ncbi:MAG TPA: terminase small subunit [Dissulfurispiraceae bacterium]|nr:terminase small subunit [Dissulfurispiraceae bacterium]
MTDQPAVKLTRRQRLFIEAYLQTWNASEAARRAGFANPGQQGHRLLKNVEIAAAVEARIREAAMQTAEVLSRLAEQARANIGEFIIVKQVALDAPEDQDEQDPDQPDTSTGVNTVTVMEIDWEQVKARGHLIKRITPGRYGTTIELHDGQTALVHIGRNLKLFTDVQEHTGEISQIEMSLEEWKDLQAKRQAQAQETLANFEDDDVS